jgi:Uma2 family endonuclease
MVDLKIGLKSVDLPYTIRLYGVSAKQFDELVDEDTKAELFDGVMIVHSPATWEHDDVSGFFRGLMSFYADAKGLGKVLGPDSLVHLATCRRFAPDAYFIRQKRVRSPRPRQFEGAPDLVVEVLSPSNRGYDLEDKRVAYHEAGVGELWIVDGENGHLLIDRRQRGKSYVEEVLPAGKAHSKVLAGFWLDASWLWAEPLPNRMTCLQQILGTT